MVMRMDVLGEIISYEFGFLAFLVGAVATLFTRYSSIPQIIKGFKTKKWTMFLFG